MSKTLRDNRHLSTTSFLAALGRIALVVVGLLIGGFFLGIGGMAIMALVAPGGGAYWARLHASTRIVLTALVVLSVLMWGLWLLGEATSGGVNWSAVLFGLLLWPLAIIPSGLIGIKCASSPRFRKLMKS
jgi:hypothetical protein